MLTPREINDLLDRNGIDPKTEWGVCLCCATEEQYNWICLMTQERELKRRYDEQYNAQLKLDDPFAGLT